MEDNWYEASVSVALPHRIIDVVDWASDSPMPIYNPDLKGKLVIPVVIGSRVISYMP